MNLTKNGITIDVADSVILELVAQRLHPAPAFRGPSITFVGQGVPEIGEAYEGGIFSGLTICDNVPHKLILLPGDFNGSWQPCMGWAEKQGGALPSRIDQLLLLKYLKKEFKSEYYWSSEHCAPRLDCAYTQNFDDGNQFWSHKDYNYLARAVRRLPL